MAAITAGLMTTTCIVFHDVQVLAFKAVLDPLCPGITSLFEQFHL